VASYRILIKPSAVKELEAIPEKDRSFDHAIGVTQDRQVIVYRIQGLAENPRPPGCEKLSDQDKYRLRQGKYRILYQVHDDEVIVVVVRVAKRGKVYKR
jgi:mRNA interferase RelE/StbE